MATVTLSRVRTGWYASQDGRWAVVGDGADAYVSQDEADGAGVNCGLNTSTEWQVVYDAAGRMREDSTAGEMLMWVDSLRQGRAEVNRLAGRQVMS